MKSILCPGSDQAQEATDVYKGLGPLDAARVEAVWSAIQDKDALELHELARWFKGRMTRKQVERAVERLAVCGHVRVVGLNPCIFVIAGGEG